MNDIMVIDRLHQLNVFIISPVMCQPIPLSASESVLLKWLWYTSLESPPDCPVAWKSGVGPPSVGALLRPPGTPLRLFLEGEGFTEDGGNKCGNDQ